MGRGLEGSEEFGSKLEDSEEWESEGSRAWRSPLASDPLPE